jgi:hypothetical protein
MPSKYIPQPEQVDRHMNVPQLRAIGVDAHTQRHVWGRRTGKTEGPGGVYTVRRVHDMPRSNGFMIGTTYEQLLTRTIPPLVAAWEGLGFYEGIHFWLRKEAPKNLRVPKAYRTPLKYDNYIQWYNGSGIYLVSQDRPGSINGVATQWGYGDEAKFLDVNRLNEEAMLTLSGKADVFGECPHFLSTMFMSDMPTGTKGGWLMEAEALMERDAVELVFQMAAEEGRLLRASAAPGVTQGQLRQIQKQLLQLRAGMGQLRRGLVHYSEATTLDNIHVLGLDVIKNFRRNLPLGIFDSSVLNKRNVQVEHGFYGLLDEDRHAYDNFDYSHIDQLQLTLRDDVEKDSRWDGDVDPYRPLEIAMDHNNVINSLVVGQEHGRDMRAVKSMYVLQPELLEKVVEEFCRYYRHHRCKHIIYHYDQTCIGLDASRNLSYADMVVKVLLANGWTVERNYFGAASNHYARYVLWGKILKENDPLLPRFRYNRTNTASLVVSMQGARTKQVGNESKKDKDDEKMVNGRPKVPPQLATHLTEAADMLIWGKYARRVKNLSSTFADTH